MRQSRISAEEGQRIVCFFDGACPLCSREADWLRARDTDGRIEWIDLARPGFRPPRGAPSLGELEASLHVRLASGEYVEGMDSFRALYAAVGFGWLLAPTGWRGLAPVFDGLYRVFARVRPWLPGRAPRCDDAVCATRER